MRVFLFQTAKGLFASSGGYRANFTVLQHLASQGHAVAQMSFAYEKEVRSYLAEMEAAGYDTGHRRGTLRIPLDKGRCVHVRTNAFTNEFGFQVIALDVDGFMRAFPEKVLSAETADFIEASQSGHISGKLSAYLFFISVQLLRFRPTHVVFNDGLSLKATCMMPFLKGVVRVAIIHSAEELPFGPYAGGISGGACSPAQHGLLRQVDAIWSVSQAIKTYALKYGQLQTTFHFHHPWNYVAATTGKLPARRMNWDVEQIGMINPCHVKGIDVFLQLAKRCPNYKFAAWSSWGSTETVMKRLQELANVKIYPTCRDMEEVWARIKVLLVPSIWLEAWGLVVVEAQLRGIPVISSDAGAIPEAKLGIPHIIPVKTITGERNQSDGYVIPDQDIEPWVAVLEKLMTDREEYESLSNHAREETASWVHNLDERALENWLMNIVK